MHGFIIWVGVAGGVDFGSFFNFSEILNFSIPEPRDTTRGEEMA